MVLSDIRNWLKKCILELKFHYKIPRKYKDQTYVHCNILKYASQSFNIFHFLIKFFYRWSLCLFLVLVDFFLDIDNGFIQFLWFEFKQRGASLRSLYNSLCSIIIKTLLFYIYIETVWKVTFYFNILLKYLIIYWY